MTASARPSLLRPERLLDLGFQSLLAAVAIIIIASLVALEAVHASDRYQVDETAGIWLSLAKDAEHGTLFPPLFDGTHYGGTRYMPLPIVSVAAVDEAVGSIVLAAKLAAYVFAAALFLLVFRILRKQGCSPAASAFLVSGLLVTNTGILAATALRFDSLATFLQLAALALVDRSRETRSVASAAVVCTLGIFSKLNALWAPAAILIWLAVRAPRKLRVFVPVFVVSLGIAIAVVELASDNRFLSEIRTLSFAGYKGSLGEKDSGSTLQNGFSRLVDYSRTEARTMVWLLPFALLTIVLASRRRMITIYQVGLLCIAPLLVITYRDQGVGGNHLIEPAVLVVVVVGGLWGARFGTRKQSALVRGAIAAVIIAAVVTPFRSTVYPDARSAVNKLRGLGNGPFSLTPLAGYVRPGDHVLSEDPYISVSVGERPTVLDSFMYLRLVKDRPSWLEALARRVAAAEFDKIVLTLPVEIGFDYGHFGGIVNGAIEKAYYLSGHAGHYWIYTRDAGAGFCPPRVRGDVVSFCGPATAHLSAFPGVTFRNGSCSVSVTRGSRVLTMTLGARFARPLSPDANKGLTHFDLIVSGPFAHPTGGGVIAYSKSRKWIGAAVALKGNSEGASFLVTGIKSSPREATGSFRCRATAGAATGAQR